MGEVEGAGEESYPDVIDPVADAGGDDAFSSEAAGGGGGVEPEIEDDDATCREELGGESHVFAIKSIFVRGELGELKPCAAADDEVPSLEHAAPTDELAEAVSYVAEAVEYEYPEPIPG